MIAERLGDRRHLFGETDFQEFSRVLPRKKVVRWRSIRLPDTRVAGRGLAADGILDIPS